MKPLPEGRIKVFKLNDGLCICRFMIFLPEGGTDRFRVDLPDILSQEVFAFFLEHGFSCTIEIGIAPAGIQDNKPIVDAFKGGQDLSVKRKLRLIGKWGRGAHALSSFLELHTPMMLIISWKIIGIHLWKV